MLCTYQLGYRFGLGCSAILTRILLDSLCLVCRRCHNLAAIPHVARTYKFGYRFDLGLTAVCTGVLLGSCTCVGRLLCHHSSIPLVAYAHLECILGILLVILA